MFLVYHHGLFQNHKIGIQNEYKDMNIELMLLVNS